MFGLTVVKNREGEAHKRLTLLSDGDAILAGAWAPMGEDCQAWTPASWSDFYEKSTGRELTGSRGWHCYMGVDNGARIPDLTT